MSLQLSQSYVYYYIREGLWRTLIHYCKEVNYCTEINVLRKCGTG